MNTKENGIWRVNERERRSKSDRRNEKKNVIRRKERKNRDGESGEEETIVLPK